MNAAPEPAPVRVLVVDDERGVLAFAQRVLAEAGYEVVVASDGPEALRLVEAHRRFDLFVVDLLMPDMDGEELARRLRQLDRNAKVLYFTGYSERLFAERGVLGASEAFIDKPVTMNGLLEAVSLLLFGRLQGLRPAVRPDREQE
jgi:two-component system, cell cycle sensor histidine kinase and response regulator CckA